VHLFVAALRIFLEISETTLELCAKLLKEGQNHGILASLREFLIKNLFAHCVSELILKVG
jgi:hypothetical protein